MKEEAVCMLSAKIGMHCSTLTAAERERAGMYIIRFYFLTFSLHIKIRFSVTKNIPRLLFSNFFTDHAPCCTKKRSVEMKFMISL
jgi:hypothetical protein